MFVVARTSKRKLIHVYDSNTFEYLRSELYDLEEDPEELSNIYRSGVVPELDSFINDFLDRDGMKMNIDINSNISKEVEDRLYELGYMYVFSAIPS